MRSSMGKRFTRPEARIAWEHLKKCPVFWLVLMMDGRMKELARGRPPWRVCGCPVNTIGRPPKVKEASIEYPHTSPERHLGCRKVLDTRRLLPARRLRGVAPSN